MIKGITIVRPAGTPEAYAKLASFFSALGFEAGRGWEEELSRGVSFLAPLGNLEFADGAAPSPAEIMVEVTGLEAIHAVARDWMIRSWGDPEAAQRLGAVIETDWKTRLFTVEPAPGHSIAFWEWDDPHKG
jgi:6,7-dimethyl-8-ribityllumazine synthase